MKSLEVDFAIFGSNFVHYAPNKYAFSDEASNYIFKETKASRASKFGDVPAKAIRINLTAQECVV
jgi:hypothetical protein